MTDAGQQYDIQEREAIRADIEREAREESTEVSRERFGPLPERRPGEAAARLRFIATMHALIQWVTNHPNLPAPWACTLGFDVADAAALEQAASELGEEIFRGRQITIFDPLGAAPEFYTPISITVRAPDRPL